MLKKLLLSLVCIFPFVEQPLNAASSSSPFKPTPDCIRIIYSKIQPLVKEFDIAQTLVKKFHAFDEKYQSGNDILYGSDYHSFVAFDLIRTFFDFFLIHIDKENETLKNFENTFETYKTITYEMFSGDFKQTDRALDLVRFFDTNYDSIKSLLEEALVQRFSSPQQKKKCSIQ